MKIFIIVSIAVVSVVFWWIFLRAPKPEMTLLEIDENDPLWKVLILWLKKRF